MPISDEDFQKAVSENMTEENAEAFIQQMTKAAVMMLPERMREAAKDPKQDIHHILRAGAMMCLGALLQSQRTLLNTMEAFSEGMLANMGTLLDTSAERFAQSMKTEK